MQRIAARSPSPFVPCDSEAAGYGSKFDMQLLIMHRISHFRHYGHHGTGARRHQTEQDRARQSESDPVVDSHVASCVWTADRRAG